MMWIGDNYLRKAIDKRALVKSRRIWMVNIKKNWWKYYCV